MKKALYFVGILCAGLLTVTAEEAAQPAEAAPKVTEDATKAAAKPQHEPKALLGGSRFEAADKNGDGAVSLDEFKVVHEERVAQRKAKLGDKFDAAREAKMPTADAVFTKLDTDGNGSLSKEEMAVGGQQMRERAGKREGAPEGGKGKGHGQGKGKGKAPDAPAAPETVL